MNNTLENKPDLRLFDPLWSLKLKRRVRFVSYNEDGDLSVNVVENDGKTPVEPHQATELVHY